MVERSCARTRRTRFGVCPHMKKPIDAFNEKWMPEPNSGCWLWLGALRGRGECYGYLNIKRKPTYAHRFSYEQFIGPIPRGFVVDHQCNNTFCVNPDHLKLMTHTQNLRRYFDLITNCPRGHIYDKENTYIAV